MDNLSLLLSLIALLLTLLDFFLRKYFTKLYLRISIPILKKTVNGNLIKKDLRKDKILDVGETKILFDSFENNIWLQCKFKNNRSTLGLIKKWKIDGGDRSLISEEIRLSFGIFFLLILYFIVLYHTNMISQYMYLLFVFAIFINYMFAYNRLNKESKSTLSEISY